ncbi:MAG TPA: hypothetical protein VM253_07375 [Candidatus Limnocylindrales bacterium]|nr:hypothetical protein [Candidatus Limnocylindrales bacterium]
MRIDGGHWLIDLDLRARTGSPDRAAIQRVARDGHGRPARKAVARPAR